MLTKTPSMNHVFEIIRLVGPTEATVVIEGEPGTEKEAVASAIHNQSPRQEGPFMTISCAALPEGQIENELFGYEEDTVTGLIHRGRERLNSPMGEHSFLMALKTCL